MDGVLASLWSMLHTSNLANLLKRKASLNLPEWSHKGCRLNAALVFLGTGKRSVEMIAQIVDATQSDLPSPERSEQWAELMLAYDVVSQKEIHRICGKCFRSSKCVHGDNPHAT